VNSSCSCSCSACESHGTYSMIFSSCENMQNYTVLCRAQKDTSIWALDRAQ
jgi:hypothetical protein